MLKSVCVLCGAYAICRFANKRTHSNLSLVYGIGKLGLIGRLADEMLRLSWQVFGIIPEHPINYR